MIGTYKGGGDFDASKPGPGFDAHRFLEHEGHKEGHARKLRVRKVRAVRRRPERESENIIIVIGSIISRKTRSGWMRVIELEGGYMG